MHDHSTLRAGAQAFQVWLTAQAQALVAWVPRLGALPVGTLLAAVGIGLALVCLTTLLLWVVLFSERTMQYHALGYAWCRALRLAQADIEAERHRQRRQTNPAYQGQPSRLAATPAQRQAWMQDLERQRQAS